MYIYIYSKALKIYLSEKVLPRPCSSVYTSIAISNSDNLHPDNLHVGRNVVKNENTFFIIECRVSISF